MSTVQKISQLSHRIFNTSVTEKSVARQSNPFAASNFKKNILNVDVFESSASKSNLNLSDKISSSSKRIYSMFVGSISDFGNKFYEGIESIKEFGSRIKSSMISAMNKIHEIGSREVRFDGAKEMLQRDISSFFVNHHDREVSKLSKMDPISEIKPMFKESLDALQSSMSIVA